MNNILLHKHIVAVRYVVLSTYIFSGFSCHSIELVISEFIIKIILLIVFDEYHKLYIYLYIKCCCYTNVLIINLYISYVEFRC